MDTKNYKKIKKEMEAEANKHGGLKDRFISINEICENVEDFISMAWVAGLEVLKASQAGLICEKIVIRISKELNEKLADKPENDDVWKKIYDALPPCILHHTIRGYDPSGGNELEPFITIFTDVTSDEGKKQAKYILDNVKA